MFCCCCYFFLFLCVVCWLWFSLWKRGGVALNVKAMLLSRFLSALLIDTLNSLGAGASSSGFGRRDE